MLWCENTPPLRNATVSLERERLSSRINLLRELIASISVSGNIELAEVEHSLNWKEFIDQISPRYLLASCSFCLAVFTGERPKVARFWIFDFVFSFSAGAVIP